MLLRLLADNLLLQRGEDSAIGTPTAFGLRWRITAVFQEEPQLKSMI